MPFTLPAVIAYACLMIYVYVSQTRFCGKREGCRHISPCRPRFHHEKQRLYLSGNRRPDVGTWVKTIRFDEGVTRDSDGSCFETVSKNNTKNPCHFVDFPMALSLGDCNIPGPDRQPGRGSIFVGWKRWRHAKPSRSRACFTKSIGADWE